MTRGAHKQPSKVSYPGMYTRREMICILGSFMIFLTSIPGHSESRLDSAISVGRHIVQLILVFLGLVTPTVPTVGPKALMHHNLRTVAPAAKPMATSMLFHEDPNLHRYTYIFQGKATFHNQPCPNASVLVRMTSGAKTVAKGAVTEPDGSYDLKVAIDAADGAPVDWSMEAYTADFNTVQLSGRQIVQREDAESTSPAKPKVVTNPLSFEVSTSKVHDPDAE